MMHETVIQNAVCETCGVPVREGTSFCYNCGSRVAEIVGVRVPAGFNGLRRDKATAEPITRVDFSTESADDRRAERDRLTIAAAERRKARINPRTPKEFTWKPEEDSSNRLIVLTALLFAAIAAGVVFVVVWWR